MGKHIVPSWENKTAPCGGISGCPAHTDIAGALHALSTGNPKLAWTIMMESHPFRGTLGRVCYSFCEEPCNRGDYDTPISIQMLEAVIGDNGFDPEWRPEIAPRNGKKAAIIGAGPAGLTAAWFLNIAGYEAVVFESEEKAGGVLRYGIPSYRLSKDIIDREIRLISDSGVKIKYNSSINNLSKSFLEKEGFDVAIVAVGAGISRSAGIEGEERAISGLDMLKRVNTEKTHKKIFKGKNIVVIGGGNVAMDTCRTSIRLGAKAVKVLYRRTETEMPAHQHEIDEAKQEGVEFIFLMSPVEYKSQTVTAEKMTLADPDDSGRRKPVPSGETVDFAADEVIMAIGQESAVFDVEKADNIFYAGDVDPNSEGTVIHAIAAGKKAAEDIHQKLFGKSLFPSTTEEVTYKQMNVDRYFEPRMRLRTPLTPVSQRRKSFVETDPVVSLEEGIMEAHRCFRCGMCIGGVNSDCDWCFRACGSKGGMDKFMVEWNNKGPLFEMDTSCDYCGKCWEDCPRYVVTPVEVEEAE